jgi:hypothetical protein
MAGEAATPTNGIATSAAAPDTTPAPAAAAASSAPAPASFSTPTSAAGGGTPSPAPAAAAATPEYVSVREALAGYGLDLRSQFPDDHQALQHLIGQVRAAEQNRQMAQYGELYVQHAGPFQQWMREQQQAQAAAAQKQAEWFKAPEYDARWESQLTRDPATGEIRAVPGAPPDLVQKYAAWRDHQRSFLDKFSRDPIGSIRPGIEQVVDQLVQQRVQQHLGQYQERSAAQSFIQENSRWLHARDADGGVLRDERTGAPQLSPLGQRFAAYVGEAQQLGLAGTPAQSKYAMAMVQRDYLAAQAQAGATPPPAAPAAPAAPADPNAAAKAAFLRQAGAGAGGTPAVAPAPQNTNGQPPAATGPRALSQRLMAAMTSNGFAPGQTVLG